MSGAILSPWRAAQAETLAILPAINPHPFVS
jgi:hypothetical protein